MSPSDSKRGKRPDENQPRPRNKLMSLGLRPTGREPVDYKDVETLRQFISDRGKIRPRRATGLTPQQQRQVATAIRNAREMALLPCESRR